MRASAQLSIPRRAPKCLPPPNAWTRLSIMSSKPPFIEQEGKYTCALACLRMLLAHRGVRVSQTDLFQQAHLEIAEVGWLNPQELARLAQKYGCAATETKLSLA